MDERVAEALQLLLEAGHLDLLAEGVEGRARAVRRAASGVAASVVACSPPRGARKVEHQVRGSGRGRGVFGVRDPLGRSVGAPSQPADLAARSRTRRVSRRVGGGVAHAGGRLAGLPCPVGAEEAGGGPGEGGGGSIYPG
ncbi:hypothetical protein NDU88_005216 [Pleurodeles waltl]|uniref:Uncharacterized protein n=1 Tax=Pleurodeles waltl TaxID=8319 RepID=A0AAV7UHE3_PLEWA|nr:hypothetical protein NDU88_005216 [Pleurodeles waltl]